MKKNYKVTLCGENIFLTMDGETGRYGFYVNIYTSGENEKMAIKNAKESVKSKLLNNAAVETEILETIELNVGDVVVSLEDESVEQGFAWYHDDGLSN